LATARRATLRAGFGRALRAAFFLAGLRAARGFAFRRAALRAARFGPRRACLRAAFARAGLRRATFRFVDFFRAALFLLIPGLLVWSSRADADPVIASSRSPRRGPW
jgi:hypothetical protein